MARLRGHSSFGRHSGVTLSLAYVGCFTLLSFFLTSSIPPISFHSFLLSTLPSFHVSYPPPLQLSILLLSIPLSFFTIPKLMPFPSAICVLSPFPYFSVPSTPSPYSLSSLLPILSQFLFHLCLLNTHFSLRLRTHPPPARHHNPPTTRPFAHSVGVAGERPPRTPQNLRRLLSVTVGRYFRGFSDGGSESAREEGRKTGTKFRGGACPLFPAGNFSGN